MKPYYEESGITIYHGHCLEVLDQVSVMGDHAITDPPYEEEAHASGRRLNGKTSTLKDRKVREIHESPLSFAAMDAEPRAEVSLRMALCVEGWILAFCQAEAVSLWRHDLESAGAKYRRSMVWIKPDSAPQLSGDRPARGYESIVAAWAGVGRSVWNGGGKRGVFTHCKHDSGMGHGGASNYHETQKPHSLMVELVELFTQPRQVILDPFAGSGTTLVAAKNCGRKAIGIELKEEYCEIAANRLRQSVLNFAEAM